MTRLLLVPDGPLHHLPFVALRPSPNEPTLGETFEVDTLPSATVWLLTRKPSPLASALILADPTLPASMRGGTAKDGSSWVQALNLKQLPHARDEGKIVLERVGGPSRLLMGDEAAESFIKTLAGAELGSFDLLHFAAHALIDEENPDRSAIILAAGSRGEDGLFQAQEIANLPLSGQVIVLSACRSAAGAVLSGEGAMALSRVFLGAGARAVVGTLWPIRDDHAAQFFDRFYESLGQGRTIGAALSETRRQATQDGMPAAAWSSVIVIGDDTAVMLSGSPPASLQPRVFVLAFLALLILVAVVRNLWMRWPRFDGSQPRHLLLDVASSPVFRLKREATL